MNASRSERFRVRGCGFRSLAVALLAAACAGAGCHTPTPTTGFELLAPTALPEPTPPTPLDHAVADLAAATLAGSTPEIDDALARVEALHTRKDIEEARREGSPPMEGLVPLCIDARNAALDDPVAYRAASKELLHSWSLHPDPALKARLEQAVADDPLKLASERTWDHYESLWATTFNTIVEPVGGSLMWGVAIAPFRLANSITNYLANMYSRPAMSVQERQALALRKLYLAEYPDASDAPAVREKVKSQQAELDRMQGKQFAEEASRSLAAGDLELAELQADRALQVDPDNADARTLIAVARNRREQLEKLRERSEQASRALPEDLEPGALDEAALPNGDHALADLLSSLLASTNVGEASHVRGEQDPARRLAEQHRLERLIDQMRILQNADPEGHLADEAEYVLALAQYDLGFEDESWRKLHDLAHADPERSNMERHARALVDNPWQNTYGNFARQRQRATRKDLSFRLFGTQAFGRRYPELPFGLSYLVEAPSIAQALVMAPIRAVFGPWEPPGQDFDRASAVAGYRYLARQPEGGHADRVALWLYDYELERKNWVAALNLYDLQPTTDDLERITLVEKAADQQLAAADRAGRRDWRGSILRGVVREFPDSDAGLEAGWRLRRELESLSPQRIRVTKSFLLENPDVAGPYGLALNPVLLDGNLHNGELHPTGVTFLGGQVMEFALVAPSGDEDDPPVSVRQDVTPERLAHTVAMLDETVLLNDQIDEGDAVRPDAFRDYYMERARLGLAARPDMRASAESDYVYESLREQYGMVRGRDSILPFDLVFQGSLFDLSLGAFPRWRQPKETPDAFLYR